MSWQKVSLGEVLTLHYGKALPKEDRNPSGSIPIYGANGIKDYSDKSLSTGPSLIIGRKGSAGEITRVEGPFWPLDVTYYTEHDDARVDFDFLEYALRIMELPSHSKGVKPCINRNEVYGLPICLPPLEEQKRIVAVLDQAFANLDRARANAESNLADMEELFENTLLKVFDKLAPVSRMLTLAEASNDFSRGKSRHRPRNDPSLYGGEYPFVQTGDIRRSLGSVREFSQTYNDNGLAQSKLWPAGTVCITIAANIAETGVLEFDGCFPDSVIGMVPDPKTATPYYAEYMLRYFAEELKAQGKGSAQDNINLATFEKAVFPFPELEVQTGVVERLDEIAGYVASLRERYNQQSDDLDDLRQSILQKAFAGELT